MESLSPHPQSEHTTNQRSTKHKQVALDMHIERLVEGVIPMRLTSILTVGKVSAHHFTNTHSERHRTRSRNCCGEPTSNIETNNFWYLTGNTAPSWSVPPRIVPTVSALEAFLHIQQCYSSKQRTETTDTGHLQAVSVS